MPETKPKTDTQTADWWGKFDFADGDCRSWHVGPLRMVLRREAADWVVAHASDEDPLATHLSFNQPSEMTSQDTLQQARFAFQNPHESLTISLRLADRPFSVRPEQPVNVPGGQAVTFYITTPLWLRLEAGDENILLAEIPSYRPSDSWFGNTRSGELCYSTRTRAKSRMADLPHPPHRATTPVKVVNKATESLRIEQLKLPMPNLALYRHVDGSVITQSVEFTRSSAGESAAMNLTPGPPQTQRISEPRIRLRDNSVLQVFDWVMGSNSKHTSI